MNCKTCKWFDQSTCVDVVLNESVLGAPKEVALWPEDDSDRGQCRCHAPISRNGVWALWPIVGEDEGCGDWSLKLEGWEFVRIGLPKAQEFFLGTLGRPTKAGTAIHDTRIIIRPLGPVTLQEGRWICTTS